MNGFGYEELAAAQQSVDFPDVNTANEWLSNNDIYINGCSFNTKRLFEAKKPLIVIRFIRVNKPIDYKYGIEIIKKAGFVRKSIDSYRKKWESHNPDKVFVSMHSESIVLGQNGSSLIGVGLVEQTFYILYKSRKATNNNGSYFSGVNMSYSDNYYPDFGNAIYQGQYNLGNNYARRYCYNCGNAVEVGARFCDMCGCQL